MGFLAGLNNVKRKFIRVFSADIKNRDMYTDADTCNGNVYKERKQVIPDVLIAFKDF